MNNESSLSALKVPLERLQRLEPIRTWQVEVRAAELQDLEAPLHIGDVLVPSDHLVVIDLVLDKVSEGVAVSGKVGVNWAADCARCLRQIDGEATAEVEELFEQDPREGESYLLGDEFLDLAAMVREAILLELPVGVVRCVDSQECSDAAPSYGAGKNDPSGETPESEMGDPRWAALDELVFDEE